MPEWETCPHCQLKHRPRSDGHCPRCKQLVGEGDAGGVLPDVYDGRALPGSRHERELAAAGGGKSKAGMAGVVVMSLLALAAGKVLSRMLLNPPDKGQAAAAAQDPGRAGDPAQPQAGAAAQRVRSRASGFCNLEVGNRQVLHEALRSGGTVRVSGGSGQREMTTPAEIQAAFDESQRFVKEHCEEEVRRIRESSHCSNPRTMGQLVCQ